MEGMGGDNGLGDLLVRVCAVPRNLDECQWVRRELSARYAPFGEVSGGRGRPSGKVLDWAVLNAVRHVRPG